MKKGQLVNLEWEDPIASAYRREEGNQFMRSYARMLTEDKNKIKRKSSLQLAEDIENFFKTEVWFRWSHVNSKDYGYFINPSISWMGLPQKDFDCWGRFVSSNEWTKRFGGEIDLEFLFYDRVEKLASQVFEVMSDTQENIKQIYVQQKFKTKSRRTQNMKVTGSDFFCCLNMLAM